MDAKTEAALKDLVAARQALQEAEGSAIANEHSLRNAQQRLEEQKIAVRKAEAALLAAVADEACPPEPRDYPF